MNDVATSGPLESRVRVAEPSTIEMVERYVFEPAIGSACDARSRQLALYTADGPTDGPTTTLSAAGTAAVNGCSYRFEVDEPGYLRSWIGYGFQRDVTVTPN